MIANSTTDFQINTDPNTGFGANTSCYGVGFIN
jgi:hypothetical protein